MSYALQSVVSNDYLNKSTEVLQKVNGPVTFRTFDKVRFKTNTQFDLPATFNTTVYFPLLRSIFETLDTVDYRLGGVTVILRLNEFIPHAGSDPVEASFHDLTLFVQGYHSKLFLVNYATIPDSFNTLVNPTVIGALNSDATISQVNPCWITCSGSLLTIDGIPSIIFNAYYNPPTLTPPGPGQVGYTLPPAPTSIIVSYTLMKTSEVVSQLTIPE